MKQIGERQDFDLQISCLRLLEKLPKAEQEQEQEGAIRQNAVHCDLQKLERGNQEIDQGH